MGAVTFPKPQDYLRRGEAVTVRVGRAARVLVGTFKSLARRRFVVKTYVSRRAIAKFLLVQYADRHNEALAANGHLTAAIYLRDVINAPAEFIDTYASAFGRKVATAHRALYAAEPALRGLHVIGNRRPRFESIACYGPDAHAALNKGALTYNRTAALIGA